MRMRNVFLSFLGTNAYITCNYFPEGEPERAVRDVRYIQQALIELYCQDFGPEDRIFIFTTQDAHQRNWLDNGLYNSATNAYNLPNQGLESVLQHMGLTPTFAAVPIAEGFSEAEIWQVFQTVYDVLEPGDRVLFDITHAFRMLPMLGMSLIQYAKALKNIEVRAVHYGAFEKLGPAPEVKQKPLSERNAPILNLRAFSDLQDWTTAAEDFVQYGLSDRLTVLANNEMQSILREAKGKNPQAIQLKAVATEINNITANLQTNRGSEIIRIPQSKFPAALSKVLAADALIKPLTPILQAVEQKMAPLSGAGELTWLEGVAWCIAHGMVQQGITQLQEGLLTWLCQHLAAEDHPHRTFFNWEKETPRSVLASVLRLYTQNPPQEKWGRELAQNPEVGHFLFAHPLLGRLASPYDSLSAFRNDINHGGYTADANGGRRGATDFRKALQARHDEIRAIVQEPTTATSQP